ncbi:MAG: hypothetical protein AAGB01_01185 [Cyanobacteria bacterium P01_F01_bin.42]
MSSPDSSQRPKLIDLRFVVDLLLARYYVVLLVGRDQRSRPRKVEGVNRVLNVIVAVLLLLGLNILLTSFLFLLAYLLKSAVGIDLLPGHLGQCS